MADAKLRDPIERLHPRNLRFLSDRLSQLVQGRLWLKVVLGMILGVGTGIALGPSMGWVSPEVAVDVGRWLALPGQIFLALIQMIVVPLVFASVIRGLAASESLEQLRIVGTRTVLFFVLTTTVAIVIGIGLAYLIQPGSFVDADVARAGFTGEAVTPVEPGQGQPLPDTIVDILPRNPLDAMVNLQMLQVVIFAILIGIALVSMDPSRARPLLELLGSLQQVSMTIVKWAMRLAPIAVFGLMAQLTAKLGFDALIGMSVYVGTVLAGLGVMLVLYVLAAVVVAREGPVSFLRGLRELQLLAFSTSSSAAVMPLSIEVAETKFGVRPSISQFVIPLGATINMNGTALYQGVAAVFLAQVFGVELSMGALTVLVLTAVAASIGSPATPGVGIVILAMVLDSVGIPAAGIGLIMGVDRILDMSRTAVNVTGDVLAAVVLDRRFAPSADPDELRAKEAEREALRLQSGADVIIADG
jgi:Na+/H+-dicarboxylate symporter